jgi:hypothetical protein
MLTYLKDGSPKDWLYAVEHHSEFLLDNFEELLANFKDHFGNPNMSATALHKIKELKQTSTFHSYASCFRKLLIHLDWTNRMKINHFRDGLQGALKDHVVGKTKPKTFDNMPSLASRLTMRSTNGNSNVHTRRRARGLIHLLSHAQLPQTLRATSRSRCPLRRYHLCLWVNPLVSIPVARHPCMVIEHTARLRLHTTSHFQSSERTSPVQRLRSYRTVVSILSLSPRTFLTSYRQPL